jgi:hypothetical protein
MPDSILTKRLIGHDEAHEVAQRLINSHFGNSNPARMSIPAKPDEDDDLVICAYIEQQRAREAAFVGLSDLPDLTNSRRQKEKLGGRD